MELSKIYQQLCEEKSDINLVFTSFRVKIYFSNKYPIPDNKELLLYGN